MQKREPIQQVVLRNTWGVSYIIIDAHNTISAWIKPCYPQPVLDQLSRQNQKPFTTVSVPFSKVWSNTFHYASEPIRIADGILINPTTSADLDTLARTAARAKWNAYADARKNRLQSSSKQASVP